MRILIIRHGDPNYEIDGLTDKGKIEAELLCAHLEKENINAIYSSPLGRARLTALPTAIKKGLEVKCLDWLREFTYAKVQVPYLDKLKNPWDFLPEFVNDHPEIYDRNGWRGVDFIKESKYAEEYDNVIAQLDNLIESHGYNRNGVIYDAVKSNHDTIAIFCHHGLGSLLVSHLLNCSPFSISQNGCMLTSSVTTFYSEERIEGKAQFRMNGFADISHLAKADEPPAFAARFCECFEDDTRH